MIHKFIVGDTVDLIPRKLRAAAAGAYKILHLMPEADANRGDPTYRVKSIAEKHERVVAESELMLATQHQDAFEAIRVFK